MVRALSEVGEIEDIAVFRDIDIKSVSRDRGDVLALFSLIA